MRGELALVSGTPVSSVSSSVRTHPRQSQEHPAPHPTTRVALGTSRAAVPVPSDESPGTLTDRLMSLLSQLPGPEQLPVSLNLVLYGLPNQAVV